MFRLHVTVYAFTRWVELGRPALLEVSLPLAAGLIGLVAFVRRARRVARRPGSTPITDLSLFRGRVYPRPCSPPPSPGAAMFGAITPRRQPGKSCCADL